MGQLFVGPAQELVLKMTEFAATAPLDAAIEIVSTPELTKLILPAAVPLTGENVVVP